MVKELRIGNWIFDDDGSYCKVIGMSPFGHSVRCDEEEGCLLLVDIYAPDKVERKGYECDSPETKPIPLTPEILEKAGFVRINNWMWKSEFVREFDRLKHYVLIGREESDPAGMLWFGVEHFETKLAINNIYNLHQLQNLYFCLTGEELQINL